LVSIISIIINSNFDVISLSLLFISYIPKGDLSNPFTRAVSLNTY